MPDGCDEPRKVGSDDLNQVALRDAGVAVSDAIAHAAHRGPRVAQETDAFGVAEVPESLDPR